MEMFCYQCEQTAKGQGCTTMGVCGKSPQNAALQDLLVHACKEIAVYLARARRLDRIDREADRFLLEALFATVTNVNFDPDRLAALLREAVEKRDGAKAMYEQACAATDAASDIDGDRIDWSAQATVEELFDRGQSVSVPGRKEVFGDDRAGLMELLTYGLKGTAAYAYHARILGQEDDDVYAFFEKALDFLTGKELTVDDLVAMNLQCGKINIRVMEMLDAANTAAYGHPVPTAVRIEPVKGKAILVSGHDLKDLEELLKQTEGKGINVYTHGEMLPCHGYPGLNKYAHLVGNYGGAWQNQRKEFAAFPGAILMTTNCIQKPKDDYFGRIFTCGPVAWPGVAHVTGRDFTPVIDAALAAEGFAQDGPDTTITVGFGHNAVLGVADKVIDAVKAGAIRHFFLVGGCDGAKSGRNYYTDFTQSLPDDTVILTLACGKYRFNKLDFGDIGGIPRLLDIGQCNDAYSAVKIALALADAFETDVNGLPLSLILSWYEQKAVCILLSLFYLGIKNIRLGPTLPAFVTPAVLDVLVENFAIKPIGDPQDDIRDILG